MGRGKGRKKPDEERVKRLEALIWALIVLANLLSIVQELLRG